MKSVVLVVATLIACTLAGTVTLSASNPKVVLDYILDGNNITCTVTADQSAWIALGVGTQMVGTDAVIARTDQNPPTATR
jgi:hypothetical protein